LKLSGLKGNNIRCEVRLHNEDLLVVVSPALMAEWLDVGEGVTVAFSAGKSFVFSYSEKGLRTELALE